MTLLREAIGDRLRRARIAQNRTLREVSTSARVSLGYLSEVERGRKEASSELLAAICAALDIPLARVLWDVSSVFAGQEVFAEPDMVPDAEMAESLESAESIAVGAEAASESEAAMVGDSELSEFRITDDEPAAATMSVTGAQPVDEDTRIVIPAPRGGTLVLVKAA